ncbi:hypothetical protein [Haloimpatiens massiliensis]|uniref:hypothetical protein n=1 Tax=Haloimpatiens massiliensis TaxID=1658110 RepID=UPI000C82B64A|nr:hypothetical protein [Haloimpatiens massiliensis]
MSKKRIVSLALAGVLLLGGGVFGTRAYFKAKSDVDANLVIKTGTLKVAKENDSKWEYKGVAEQVGENEIDAATKDVVKVSEKTNSFDVVKPGDVFEKVVTITNTGDLHERIKAVKVEGQEVENLYRVFDIKIEGLTDNKILAPNETMNIKITATLKSTITNGDTETTFENQNNDTRFDMTKLTTAKLVQIDGYQVNDPSGK